MSGEPGARYDRRKQREARLAGGPLSKPHNGLATLAKTCGRCGAFNTLPRLNELHNRKPVECPRCRAVRKERARDHAAEVARARKARPEVRSALRKYQAERHRLQNDATRIGAEKSRRRDEWTSAELGLAARYDLTAREVAVALGRSMSAVENARHRIRTDPKTARLAGLDNDLARLAQPETINIEPRYER